MPAEPGTRSFDIGYILFIDIVGYSKLPGEKQTKVLRQLTDIVRGTPEFRRAEMAGQLVRLPAGDGMALVFFASPEAPVQCALEISRALKQCPHLQVRMGVNSGPIDRVNDVNDRANVSGAGINMAQRVMSCGDADHILLGKHIADDLAQYEKWRPHLRDLGQVEVKHGVKIDIVNFCFDGIGNSELPAKIKQGRRQARLVRQKRLIFAGALLLMALFIAWSTYQRLRKREGVIATIPEKSIAVLPFENRSAEKNNAFFADGVQDEILTDLARIADLKVISRTSVMQYKAGTARDARGIAQALGVAYLLEGSVQRAGGKIRINAQLIDARTDTHRWAQSYDRDLADVFAIQTEIAETIAKHLRSELSANERAAIEKAPTTDVVAYDLYTQAAGLARDLTDPVLTKEKLPRAIALLTEAVTRDRRFVAAWCLLSKLHARMYSAGFDHTPERLEQVRRALDEASGYEPNAGEVHLARANYYYETLRDYQRARTELTVARSKLPNSAQTYELNGYILRRQGEWEEATLSLERAAELDPRNVHTLQQLALTYQPQRRYADQIRTYQRVLEITPQDWITRLYLALVPIDAHADVRPFQAYFKKMAAEGIPSGDQPDDINYDLCERSAEAYARGLANYPLEGAVNAGVNYPRSYWEGVVALLEGKTAQAQHAFNAARTEVASSLKQTPDLPGGISLLGLIDAGLGRKEDAIREGRRACDLLPMEKDALDGVVISTNLAQIYTWTGEPESAIEQLETIEGVPNYLSYGLLKLQPFWDPLRGDPRFEKLVASLAPKD